MCCTASKPAMCTVQLESGQTVEVLADQVGTQPLFKFRLQSGHTVEVLQTDKQWDDVIMFAVRLQSGKVVEVPADQLITRQGAKEAQMNAAADALTAAIAAKDPEAVQTAIQSVQCDRCNKWRRIDQSTYSMFQKDALDSHNRRERREQFRARNLDVDSVMEA